LESLSGRDFFLMNAGIARSFLLYLFQITIHDHQRITKRARGVRYRKNVYWLKHSTVILIGM
jgi:hypothetical protein